jgi:hypothetical protein
MNRKQPRNVSAAQIAKGVEGFNRAPKLTATARRLGIELVGHMNVLTFRCDPSEARLAFLLGVSERAIRQAKTELKKLGLISWRKTGDRQTCSYRVSFDRLSAITESKNANWQLAQQERQFRHPRNSGSG